MFNTKIIVIAFTLCVIGDAAFVDSIGKCSIKDVKCMLSIFQKGVISVGDDGIPELGIPSIDPIMLKDVKISIPDVVDVTLIEGKATGIKSCQFKKFTVDFETGKGSQENICDITIDGKYKVFSDSPPIKNLLGGSTIHGEGNGKIVLEKIRLIMDFTFFIFKKDDGEIYLKIDAEKSKHDFEVLEPIKFSADKLYLGDQEASKLIIDLLNENWKIVMSSYGRVFIDKAVDIYFDVIGKFFDAVPVKHFISDDLTAYVKN